MADLRVCAVDGCGNAHRALGYCYNHWRRLKLYGDPLGKPSSPPKKICSVEGCSERAKCRGFCGMHYQRWFNNGDPLIVRRGGNKKGCTLPERVRLDMAAVAWMYEIERLSADEIGKTFGCSGRTVIRKMRAHGIKVRHRNDTKRGAPSPRRHRVNVARAVKLYSEKNASISSVAQALGVGIGAVRRALESKGVRIKTLSEVVAGTRHGENNSNWNPNLTDRERELRRPTSKHVVWRTAVYERDGFTCQCCGDDRGGNLNAHHLSSYHADKERRWDVSNGITLCDPCHRAFHKAFGYRNNTEAQFQAFLAGRQKQAA